MNFKKQQGPLLTTAAIILSVTFMFASRALGVEKTSADNRQSLTGTIYAAPNQVTAGYFIDAESLVTLNYAEEFFVIGSSNLPASNIRTSLSYEKFLGNSFFINGGIGRRTLRYAGPSLSDFFLDKNDFGFTYTDMGVNAGLGNRWQWENFTIGAQWIGVYVPVTQPKVSYNSGLDNDPSEQEKERRRRDRLSGPSLTGGIQIGLSF